MVFSTRSLTQDKLDKLKICIDARLVTGQWGGVEQFVLGLADGLSQIETSYRFDFIAYERASDWLRPYVKGPCRLVEVPMPRPLGAAGKFFRSFALLRWLWENCYPFTRFGIRIPHSNGWIEREGYDVAHFTAQMSGFLTQVPSVYNPHDLQHLHLPQFFTPRSRRTREQMYRAFCNQARVIVASSNWVKQDLIREYGLAPDKIAVVPLAPPVDAYTDRSISPQEVRKRFNLPEFYIFYPAQTWPHKNHLFLLEALALLRARHNLYVPLVCAGKINDFFVTIQHRMRLLSLENQVFFLGFVDPSDLRALYAGARCVVIPTSFEAGSFPLMEAFTLGVAAAASRVTSLPEQAGDAALLFSPDNLEEMAACVLELWMDEGLRHDLIEKGKTRIKALTWKRTAEGYLEVYHRAAGPDQEAVHIKKLGERSR